MSYYTRKPDAPSRDVTEIGPGDFIKTSRSSASWVKVARSAAHGAERLPHHHDPIITDEYGQRHSMMGVYRYAKAEDMERHG